MRPAFDVAVIGAGVAGAAAARALVASGRRVIVIDKARGPGGRCSTRRAEGGGFDHGAQYFTVRDPAFAEALLEPSLARVVAPWPGRIGVFDGACWTEASPQPRLVAVPGMSGLPRQLLGGIDCRFGAAVARLVRSGQGWSLLDGEGEVLVEATNVIVTAPPTQAKALLGDHSPRLAGLCTSVRMQPCWAVLARFAAPLATPWDGGFINAGPLAWCARDSSKPGRAAGERWVLHGAPAWSQAHIEDPAANVAALLVEAFMDAIGMRQMPAEPPQAHRWRHALAEAPLAVQCGWDADVRLGLAGDWLAGSRIEGAWRSGTAIARAVG